MEFYGNDVAPTENHGLRVSMENLRLRDDCQREEYIKEIHPVSLRGQKSQLVDGQLNQTKDVFKPLEVCGAHPEDVSTD